MIAYKKVQAGDPAWNLAQEPRDTAYMLTASKGTRRFQIEVLKNDQVVYFKEDTLDISDDCLSRWRADDLDHAKRLAEEFLQQ